MDLTSIYFLFLSGSIGSLVRLLVESNSIILPKRITGGLAMGFIGSMLIGGFAGIVIDGSLLTAGLAGYVGASVIEGLLPIVKNKVI